jgi:alpha-1,2-mannosyltransferase
MRAPAGQPARARSDRSLLRLPSPRGATGPPLALAAAAALVSLAAYVADAALHSRGLLLNWYDLGVYHQAGLIARHDPAALYSWQLRPGIKFTYTPFAAVAFAAGSLLPLSVLHWLMTAVSLAAVAVTGWLTLGALGWPGRRRLTGALAIAALALWTEPVLRALQLGQLELVLMALVVWDLCQPDERRWKGAGVGLAAGIKLVPLIFIPYLILAGRLRQAAVAAAAFGATVAAGFALLPRPSEKWWLSGYFLHPGNVGDVGSLVNQSLLAVITRAMGSMRAATPVWLAVAALVTAAGLVGAALLDRSGRPVEGWITCALTGLLVSPVSWDHHWVWIVPVLVLLADRAMPARGTARGTAPGAGRWACWVLLGAVAALFGGWPDHWTGPLALVPDGLLGFFVGQHPVHEIYHLHGIQLITWNLYVVGGLVMFAVALAAAGRLAAGRLATRRLAAKMPVADQ